MLIFVADSLKECDTDNNYSPDLISPEVDLNIPAQERLLPVGTQSKEIGQLVERVKKVLGIPGMSKNKNTLVKYEIYNYLIYNF